ncbi:PEGA domain-containing protein, partial [Myxococcota bacterium]|nr:PEGA domain-containing protein [Myxococcota bacterium]
APDASLELADSPRARPRGEARPAAAKGRAPERTGGGGLKLVVSLVLLVAVLGGLGAAAWLYQDQLLALVRPAPAPSAKLTSVYRIISDPPGAQVLVDDAPQTGVTPVELELIPDVEYTIAVKLPKYATKIAVVKASVGTEVRPIQFKLEAAASLRITSDPPGALVSIDGRKLSNVVTPVTLEDVASNQDLKVTAEIKGLTPSTKTVSIPAGKKKALHFTLDGKSE